MKKTIVLCLLLAVLMCSDYVLGATVGNPVGFPGEKKFSFGLDYWNVNTKDMVEYDDDTTMEIESDGYTLRVSYGLSDIMALDFRVGQAGFNWIDSVMDFDNGLMWGFGARALIYESPGGMRIMSGVQYNDYSPEDSFRESINADFEGELDELDVSIDVSKQFANRFTIYGGLLYSNLTFKYFHDGSYGQREGGLEQDGELGAYGGVDVILGKGFSAYAEGHFANEEAFSFGILYSLSDDNRLETPGPPSPYPDNEENAFSDKFHLGAELSIYTDKKMIEEDGLVPEYSNYRMASKRGFLVFSYDVIERITAFVKVGKADLDTHSSEGETDEFSGEIAWAIGARGDIFQSDNGINISGEVSYLTFDPEEEETVSTAKESFSAGGDRSIEWSELNISFEISKEIEKTTTFAGVSYTNITADQERTFAGGTTVSSSFDAEDDLGLFVGFTQDVTESLSLEFKANFMDIRGYTFGGTYSF